MTVVLQPLLSVFALKASNGNSGGVCLVDGLDAMVKLLLPLLCSAVLLVAVSLLLLLAKLRALAAPTKGAEGQCTWFVLTNN